MILFKRLLFLCLFLMACAKPNYQDLAPQVQDSTPQGEKPTQDQNQDQGSEQCKLFFKVKRLCLKYEWLAKPKKVEDEGLIEFKFYVQEKPTEYVDLDPKDVSVIPWMPSMGHGSSPVTIEETKPGVFRAKEIFFIMPGPWEIKFKLEEEINVVEKINI